MSHDTEANAVLVHKSLEATTRLIDEMERTFVADLLGDRQWGESYSLVLDKDGGGTTERTAVNAGLALYKRFLEGELRDNFFMRTE